MAKKKLVFVNNAEEDGKQTLDKTEEVTAALASPKKMKPGADRERVGSEPVEDGYACSSPSASDFIVMPTLKPTKKPSSSKKFSDEDEIALLKGLADFWANGRNNKWAEFYQFIKDKLTNQFSKIQVSEKVRHLKIKFEKARANGRLDFPDSHEENVFSLCEALWGDEKGAVEENKDEEANKMEKKRRKETDGVLKKKRKERKKGKIDEEHQQKEKQVDEDNEGNNSAEKGKEQEDNEGNNSAEKGKEQEQVREIRQEDFQSEFPLLYASFDTFKYGSIVKEKCNLVPKEKAQELEEKCRELKAEMLRLELKRIDLMKRDLQDYLQRI